MKTANPNSMSWKEAILTTKGPTNLKDSIILFIKGLFMGAANIIPGVSGGTIALITGIYQELLFAIRSFNMNTIRHLKNFQFKEALNTVHLRFLFALSLGVAVAIFSLAHLMNFVFVNYPIFTWAFFFGLIIASIIVMGLRIDHWLGAGGVSFLLGTAGAYLFVGLIPVSTPETWWFIMFVGGITICTMILPGLSGAFLLLILGKYEYITGAVKNPFIWENFIILSLFVVGCGLGIIAFSRLLSFMLKRFENVTMAMLTGIMCGSLRKVWPWKEVVETKMIRGKEHIISEANIFPAQLNAEFWVAVVFALVGFVIVIVLEKSAAEK